MKKAIIGALIGGVLVFGWQAVSHMFLHHHDASLKQIPDQANVINTLSKIFKEDGQYLVPRSNPTALQEEMTKFNEGMKGKPWALITYHSSDETDMAMSAFRSFTTAFLSVLIFIWLIDKTNNTFLSVFTKSLGLAVLIFLFVWYNSNIWMQTPWEVLRAELIDLLVAWGLCGLWLGAWLPSKRRKTA
jgi:hypothetical protein